MTKKRTSKRPLGSIVMNVAVGVLAATAVASLVNNLYSFWTAVDQYVAQGYTTQEVVSGLLPSQLLPGLFQSIAVYGGIAAVVFGLGQINSRLASVPAPSLMPAVPDASPAEQLTDCEPAPDEPSCAETAEAALAEPVAPAGR